MGVNTWTALTSGTDYTPQAGVTLTMATEGNQATVAIANTGASTTMDIQVRGTPVVRGAPIEITTPDAASVADYGPAPYPFLTPWLASAVDVSSLHTFLLAVYSQPAERLTLRWEVDSDRNKATALDLSDRVTVRRRGIASDYFIESIRHRLTRDFHFLEYTLSPAGVYGEIFILGQSRLGVGILAA